MNMSAIAEDAGSSSEQDASEGQYAADATSQGGIFDEQTIISKII